MTWPAHRAPVPMLSGLLSAAPPSGLPSGLHVQSAWRRSSTTHTCLREALAGADLAGIHTVYVVGSLGRMEQLTGSDCDLIVVTEDVLPPAERRMALDAVWQALSSVDVERPRSDGIYAQPVAVGELLDPAARGRVDESLVSFGARMQLLLEGQPVYAEPACSALIRDVLQWYGTPGPEHAAVGGLPHWQYLLHDLQRYWRALCIRTQWIDEPARWRAVNIKLRHSRRLAYLGLLVLLAQSAAMAERNPHEEPAARLETWVKWLSGELRLTPLERVLCHTHTHEVPAAIADLSSESMPQTQLVRGYDRFLEFMECTAFDSGPDADMGRLWRNAAEFEARLDDLVRQSMTRWPDGFRKGLLL